MHEVWNTLVLRSKYTLAERKTKKCVLRILKDSYPPTFLIGVIVLELISYSAICKVLKTGWLSPVNTEVTQEARVFYLNIGRWIHCGKLILYVYWEYWEHLAWRQAKHLQQTSSCAVILNSRGVSRLSQTVLCALGQQLWNPVNSAKLSVILYYVMLKTLSSHKVRQSNFVKGNTNSYLNSFRTRHRNIWLIAPVHSVRIT